MLSSPISAEEHPSVLELGRRLHEVRVAAGFTRQQLADATALNPQTIYRIERGLRRTRRRTLGVIAEALTGQSQALAEELTRIAGPALANERRHE